MTKARNILPTPQLHKKPLTDTMQLAVLVRTGLCELGNVLAKGNG